MIAQSVTIALCHCRWIKKEKKNNLNDHLAVIEKNHELWTMKGDKDIKTATIALNFWLIYFSERQLIKMVFDSVSLHH